VTTPFFVTSTYSFHFGTASPRELARQARALGYDSLALTDRNGVYGVPTFIEACEAEGLRPVIGTELVYGALPDAGGRALLVAIDGRGFSRICHLLSALAAGSRAEAARAAASGTHAVSRKYRPPVAGFDACAELLRDSGGLAVISDDPQLLAATGAEGFYALLSPCNRPRWQSLLKTGRRPLATGEVRFLEPGDQDLQRLLVAIGSGKTLSEVSVTNLAEKTAILCGPADFEAAYRDVPEALAENRTLADRISFRSLFSGFIFPRYAAAAGPPVRDEPGGCDESSAGNESAAHGKPAAAVLRRLVYHGAAQRYGPENLDERVRERIEHELAIIEEKGFSDYFLVVRDIVRKASRTCGRGSAAASVVSYALSITDVDPIRHNLYFERFLNPGRIDPPDIDVDFAWDERDALLASVIAGYGEERAARVSNHVCFQPRSALRETARAFGMPDGEISAFEKRLVVASVSAGNSVGDYTSSGASDASGTDDDWQQIASLSRRLEGIPRHLGVHSGGLILVPEDLAGHVPIVYSGTGIRITAWDKDGVEAAGLVKIDLLGNRSLAVVRDALTNVRDNGTRVDENAWHPIDDPATVELLARGDSMGVFYVESPAMRLLQKKTGRGDYEHLVIHSSIIRPAANRYINEYIDRLKGAPYEPLHPLIGDLLAESYGIMCYQEDVCKVAVALAGFSAAEADRVRKILAKRDYAERLVSYKQQFYEGARAKGVGDATIAEVWAMIESFSGYSFVKAHSASYAMLSFRSAWLRCHHPAEFMAAVISNHGGYYSTLAYVSEARRMGLTVMPPDVDESGLRCRGRGTELRFGLGMIHSLGEASAAEIVEERRARGPYRTIEALARRVRLDRSDAEALAGSGALDSVSPELSRAAKLMRLLSMQADRETQASYPAMAQGELFSAESPRGLEPDPAGAIRAANGTPGVSSGGHPGSVPGNGTGGERRRLEAELRYLGTTLAVHPLALWPGALRIRRSQGRDLPRLVGHHVTLIGWPITAKPVLAANEQPMEFVSFEDETALYETVLFPAAYARFRHLLYEQRPLLLHGLVEEDRGAVTITLEGVETAG
jgi:DNA polymerase-3 subunit alpha/error-prone DNA polymerase